MTEQLRASLDAILKALAAQDYDARELVFAPPASDGDVKALERDIGVALPISFRSALTTLSSHVEFRWFAPQLRHFPPPFASNFCGNLHWSLDLLRQFERERQEWVRQCFPDPTNDYDRVWHDKLAIQEVGNGDFIALDLKPEKMGQVVYLSHDDGEGHGLVLAPSFLELIERWVPLACTGAEDWQWMHFLREGGTGLDPWCDNGRVWRELLRIQKA